MQIKNSESNSKEGAFCFNSNCKGILYKTKEEAKLCAKKHEFFLFHCKDIIKVASVQDENKFTSARNLQARLDIIKEISSKVQCDLNQVFFFQSLPFLIERNIDQTNILMFNNLSLRTKEDEDYTEDGRSLVFSNQKKYIKKMLQDMEELNQQITFFIKQLQSDEEDVLKDNDELYFSKAQFPFTNTQKKFKKCPIPIKKSISKNKNNIEQQMKENKKNESKDFYEQDIKIGYDISLSKINEKLIEEVNQVPNSQEICQQDNLSSQNSNIIVEQSKQVTSPENQSMNYSFINEENLMIPAQNKNYANSIQIKNDISMRFGIENEDQKQQKQIIEKTQKTQYLFESTNQNFSFKIPEVQLLGKFKNHAIILKSNHSIEFVSMNVLAKEVENKSITYSLENKQTLHDIKKAQFFLGFLLTLKMNDEFSIFSLDLNEKDQQINYFQRYQVPSIKDFSCGYYDTKSNLLNFSLLHLTGLLETKSFDGKQLNSKLLTNKIFSEDEEILNSFFSSNTQQYQIILQNSRIIYLIIYSRIDGSIIIQSKKRQPQTIAFINSSNSIIQQDIQRYFNEKIDGELLQIIVTAQNQMIISCQKAVKIINILNQKENIFKSNKKIVSSFLKNRIVTILNEDGKITRQMLDFII